MKILDYSNGYFNISTLPYLEIQISKNANNIFDIYLKSQEKAVFIFSCENEDQAKKFRTLFNHYLMEFVKDGTENYTHLMILIHIVVDELLGGIKK